MISKAGQILSQYLLNDLVYMVEAYNPEMLLCEQLIDMINDDRVLMDLHPGASRTGFKQFITGPIMKMPGWTYTTPSACILTITAAKSVDNKDLELILNKLYQVDDIQSIDLKSHRLACDAQSMLYQHLNHHGLIEKAVPQ